MFYKRKISVLFLFMLELAILSVSENIWSQSTLKYSNESNNLPIASHFYLFNDTSVNANVHDILQNSLDKFVKSEQEIPSFSFTRSTIWCKFSLVNTTGKPVYLEISPPILNDVTLYQFRDTVLLDSMQTGSFYPAGNYYHSSTIIFKLNDEANEFIIKIKSKTRLYIQANILSQFALMERDNVKNMLKGVYAGLILMILAYHLFLFYTSREKIYFYYILHIINAIIYFLYLSGIGIYHIWSDFPMINSFFLAIMSLGFILSIIFVIQFIESKKNSPTVHKLLQLVILFLCLNAFLDLIGFNILAGKILNYIGFFSICTVVITSIMLIKKGFKPAGIFLSAWIFYLVGIGIQTMQSLNFIATNSLTSNAILIGSAFEFILLSIAVGEKINFYKISKILSRQRGRDLLFESQDLRVNQNIILENRLQQQTELLYAKNRELKLQNKENEAKLNQIIEQNEKINEIHNLLEEKNVLFTRQNQELLVHKENLEQLVEDRTRELKEATRLAMEADEQKTAFLKNFSHELRTPMNAIAGFANLLTDMDVEDKSFDYYTGIIVDNTDNLLELVDNIVDLSKLQNNELSLKSVKFNPARMFIAIRDSALLKIKKGKKSFIDFFLEVPENCQSIYADYNRVYKIVFQLVDNSIKYTESGYIKLGFTLDETLGSIEIFVIDTGIGIKKEKLDVVFDSFQKLEQNRIKFYPGTGLGLSLVKGLVEVMNGELIINTLSEDEPVNGKNSGTSIKVILPGVLEVKK